MLNRVVIGVTALVAVIAGVAPGVLPDSATGLILVLAGLIWGAMAVDAEDSVQFLAVAIAVGAAAGSDVLNHIPAVGMMLDGVLGGLSVALYGGVASVAAVRLVNRLKG